ncbi:MAG: hypothetical protein WAM04_04290 [Candidatus Sulfotelmatobacter sp.]
MNKATEITILLVLGLTVVGCGSSSVGGLASNINGSWTATLTDPNGSIAYQFSATFTQGTGSELTVTNFTFTSGGSCFGPYSPGEYGESGSFTLVGNSNGKVTGMFGMVIATPNINGPALNLQGTLSGSTISGRWTASAIGGCSANGTFTIQPAMAA